VTVTAQPPGGGPPQEEPFKIVISSPTFKGLSSEKRHELIMGHLKEERKKCVIMTTTMLTTPGGDKETLVFIP